MNNIFFKITIIILIFLLIYSYCIKKNNKEYFNSKCENVKLITSPSDSPSGSPCESVNKKCINNKIEIEHSHLHTHSPSLSNKNHSIKNHNNTNSINKHKHKHKHKIKCKNIKGCIKLDINFVVPHFKFPVYKNILKNNNFQKVINKNWLLDYNNYICDKKCGCSKKTNYNICMIDNPKSKIKYQCPKLCKTCNKCHNAYPSFKLNKLNDNLCNNVKTKELKEKCLLYKDRVIKEKTLCEFIPNNKINYNNFSKDITINSKFFKNKCNLFMNKSNNKFSYLNDMILHIKLNYENLDENLFENININICKFDLEDKKFNIFYIDKNDIYLLLETSLKNVNDCILFILEGEIKLKNIKNKKFSFKQNIKIYKKQADINPNENYYKEYLKSRKNLNIYDRGIISSYGNDYQNNYLQDKLSIKNCQLNKDYFVFNPNLDIEEKEYKKETLIDNPDTWRERIDVNRPWIFTS